MKISKYGLRYAHTAAEWAEVIKIHGPGLSLTGSAAKHLRPKPEELQKTPNKAKPEEIL